MNGIKTIIQDEKYELSSNDIKRILGISIKIISYPQLAHTTDVMEIFDSMGRCVLFCETTSDNVGHWEAIFYNQKTNTIEFFDSYGLPIDGFKKYIAKNTMIKLNEYPNFLTKLLSQATKDGYDVVYNTIDYQSWRGSVSTCGRFVTVRLLHKNLSEYDFYNYLCMYMKQNQLTTFDEAVTKITLDIIGK